MKHLDGKTISILGLGASGTAAARLALSKGGEVYVSDWRVEPSTTARGAELRELGARVELGEHDLGSLAESDTVVVSPGIPPDAPVLQALRARGCRWVSEPEFAFRFLAGPLIAVTGTNGKTTTAALTAHLLREAGVEVGLGGNIGAAFGPPVSELAMRVPVPEWFVVELSSFQLADIQDLAPAIGVVTNLAPDHLDRYDSVDDYYGDKARLFDTATAESQWVLNGDDPAVETLAGQAPGARYRFTTMAPEDREGGEPVHASFSNGELFLGELPLVSEADLPLLGRHNVANALAASLTASLAGVEPASLTSGLRGFRSLAHRMEPVGDAHGLRWVNDSKATNVAATVGALRSLEGPLVLLLGGTDKGEDLRSLKGAIHPGVRGVVLYGEARHRFASELTEDPRVTITHGSFEDAVASACGLAETGDMILLSPACSSFDMFENYEARGQRFASLARGEG